MRTRNKLLAALCAASCVSGCSSTGIVPMDAGTYMVAKRSAQVGFGPADGVKADIYAEANAFCSGEGKTVETISLDTVDSGLARPANASLKFRCVPKH